MLSFAAVMVIHVLLVGVYALSGGTFARAGAAAVIGTALAAGGAMIAGRDANPFWSPSTPRGWVGSVVQGVAPLYGLIFGAHWLPSRRTGPPEGYFMETIEERILVAFAVTVVVLVLLILERRREDCSAPGQI